MMAKHTPGPWKVISRTSYQDFEPGVAEPDYDWLQVVRDCEPATLVCDLSDDSVHDAELIAAAPDLLAALEELLRVVYEGDWHTEVQPALKQAKSAVAKVEGGMGRSL